ncbi:MAG: helix-turn-helix domain-containing protein, partial [Thermoanaerobaculia bacterium]
LNVVEIRLPPLRERPDDIIHLAERFLAFFARDASRPVPRLSPAAIEVLRAYPWPGNVRELRNAIERAILLCDGGLITAEHLPAPPAPRLAPADPHLHGGVDLGALDRSFVEKAFLAARGNKSRAARLLGLSRAQLYSRLERYGIR